MKAMLRISLALVLFGGALGSAPAQLPPPPTLSVPVASPITSAGATLRGGVNPNGTATAVWFEWGQKTNYGNLTAMTNVGSGNASVSVAAGIVGLTPVTIYHCRTVATNAGGQTFSPDRTFTTVGTVDTECGGTGNTYWSVTAASSLATVALGSTNIYLAAGSTLSIIARSTGAEINSRVFSGVMLGQLRLVRLKGGSDEVIVTGDNGYVYGLHSVELSPYWSRSLLRPACTSDSISAAPVVQLFDNSDVDFRAALNKDVVMVGTRYGCATATANRVYGLNASTGDILWIFNPTGASQMDAVNGLALDYGRNTVYAVSDHSNAGAQNTVWALSTTNGAKRWSVDLGAVGAEPGLGNDGVYVGSRSGILYKLDPATGTTIWQTNVTSGGNLITRLTVDAPNGRIYVVDSGGTLHAYLDECSSAVWLWDFKPGSASVTAAPALHNIGTRYVYAGADDGKVWQVNGNSGVAQAYATVLAAGAAPSYDPVVLHEGTSPAVGYRLLALSGVTMKKFCIPWPDTSGDHALLSGPNCVDAGGPTTGLTVAGDLGSVTSLPGQSVTRILTVSNLVCYPFQCVTLLGDLPSGMGVSALSSTNGTTAWDTNSFLSQATAGLPMQFSLTVTSSIPGTYLTTLTLANAGTVHATLTLTNIVVQPSLSIALNGANAEVTWATNAAGFQLQCAPSLTPPVAWQTISSGITTSGSLRHYLVTDTALTTNRFYRLRKP